MTASIALQPISFQYSITPGATPDPTHVKVGGLAINLADKTLYSKDQNGEMFVFPLGNSYDAVLQQHFTAQNPHGTWDKEVLVDDGDVSVTDEYDEWHIKRIGTAAGTVTLSVDCPVGSLVYIDNVRTTCGQLTVASSGGVMSMEGIESAATHTLSGKGQIQLVKISATDWEITELQN